MVELHLIDDVLAKDLTLEPNRKGFGKGLLEAGKQFENVVAACADLTESTQISLFAEAFPERFVEVGVAEQNLVTLGSGLAAMGKIPFVSSYGAFNPGRNWEQIRTTICLNDRPVKIVGAHTGLYTGADGATHQVLEDIALMRVLPNMVVIVPGDSLEAEKAVLAMTKDPHPNYLRLTREATPLLTTEKTPFQIGKAYVYTEGKDLSVITTGTMTYQALVAAEKLFAEGIDLEVVHVPTIKPLDKITILGSVHKTKKVLTVEEHQVSGGLGGAVAELLGSEFPVQIKRMGVNDKFGQSGKPEDLLEHYGLTAKHIMASARRMVK